MLWSVRHILCLLVLMLLAPTGFSQHGPMGIGNADGTPTSAGPQPKLILWLDGSSAEPYINSAPVDVWSDKSGNNHNFLPFATYKPSLRTGGTFSGPSGTFSGAPETPCVKFLDRDDQLFCSDFELSENGYSIYYVIRSDDDDYGLFSYSTISNENETLIYSDVTGTRQQMDAPPVDRASSLGDLSNDQWNYGGITWSNSDADNWEFTKTTAYQGGFATFNGISLLGSGSAMIGEIQNASGIYPAPPDPPSLTNFEGSIAEIIIFEGRISRPATRLLRTYFWVKYGLNGDSGGWDKYHGNMDSGAGNEWGGKYYAPIGIGNDIVNPNAGSINEARSEGLVLRVNEDQWTQTRSYMCAAPVGNSITELPQNDPTTDGCTAPVIERWSRLWEISGNNEGNSQVFQIGFDFGEGIEGDIPQNPENFVLLYRTSPSSGNFSILPIPDTDKFVLDDEIVFRVPKSSLITPGRYYTLGTVDASSSLTGDIKRTWYAYESGNWSDPNTWTLDGSAAPSYVNPGNDTPNIFDDIFIGAGRNVTVDLTLPSHGDLRVFGTLDFASVPQSSFVTIGGSGLIRCSAGNFPTGISTGFADPDFGGTLEFYGAGGFSQTTDLEVNKLKINLSSESSEMTLVADLTTNGLFEVNRGTFIINNTSNVSRTITTNAQVLVEGQGIIKVSNDTGLIRHKWFFHDDLINNGGEVKFTNRTVGNASAYSTNESNHIVEAFFVSSNQNQELRANGESYFSRIVIDKGVDETYILSISSNNVNYFKLLGRCQTNLGPFQQQFVDETINQNSFALINGTAEIRANIFIPLFINNGIYNVNHTAQIWVNGGEVTYSPFGTSANSGALVLYGIVKVTDGSFNVFNNNGIVIRANGLVQVDGGSVNTNQIRTSLLGPSNIGGLIINDGEVNINGNRPEGSLNTYYTLSLTYPGNLFRMTGGELNITGPTSLGLVFINSDPQNTSVSGGTVNLDVSDTQDRYNITSRAPFWNLSLTRSSTSSAVRNFKVVEGSSGPDTNLAFIQAQDLIVRNMLSLTGANTPRLQMGTATAPADLYVHGNLTMGAGSVYIHNKNTTHFVGSSNSSLTFGGSNVFPFHNVEVNKDIDSRNVNIQQTGPNPSMDILGSLFLEKGYFKNNNRSVDVRGNIINRTQFGDDTSTGNLRMRGTSGQQSITSDGGVLYSIVIDNPDGVTLLNDGITVKNRVFFSSGSFFIGDNKLRMETTNPNPFQSYNSTNKYVVCSGNASAGGVEILNHSDSQTLVYPLGVNTSTGQKYTWAQIYVNSGWTDNGFVQVTPVDTLLSTTDLLGSPDFLNYYWRVSSTGYDTKPNVTHQFRYVQDDVRGIESNFESGRVLSELPFTRSIDNAPVSAHVNISTNTIYYNGTDQAEGTTGTGALLVNADYSAGAADRFPIGSSPDVFFTRSPTVGAVWENPLNWNKLSDCSGCTDAYDYHSVAVSSSSEYPETGDIAVIGFDVDNPYRPHVYTAPPGGIEAAQVVFTPLQDASGVRQSRYYGPSVNDIAILRPTLEITNTSDIIKVGQISGEGALMLKGNIDLGVTDIGGFLVEDSSIVVINNGLAGSITMNFLPSAVPNLFLAETELTITSDIQVRGKLEVAGNSKLYLSETLNGNIEVESDLILDKYQLSSGSPEVIFNRRGELKTINVHGDVRLLGTSAHIGIDPLSGPEVPPVPWTPSEIDAFIWLDATVGVTTSGSEVSAWQDQATGAYIATQADPGKRPTYQIGMNGLNTLRFDGVDDFLAIPHSNELNLSPNQDFEIFAVSQFNDPDAATPADFSIIYGKGVINSRDFLLYLAIDKFRVYMDQNRMGIIAPTDHTIAPNLGWVRRQGNSGALYNTVGGFASKGNVANASMVGNTHDVTIGAAEDGTQRFMDGDISEILLIKRALTNEERQRVEGYLAHKWGLEDELPDGHPYKNEVPIVGGNDNTPAQLIVDANIIQNLSNTSPTSNGLELFEIGTDTAFVNLIASSAGTSEFDNLSGPAPRLWKLTVDKGININSSFTFNSEVIIGGPPDELAKPVEIRNGLLKFNDPNIDVALASGGGDFVIPVNGGLELNDGQLRISGNETGLLLSGSLKITGGIFNIGEVEGENNYIEYGGGSSPDINISGGTLIVGSQIRRNLSSLGGALDYRQSGGDVILGRFNAPEPTRGILEVVNPGSRFDHTGGTLTFVRGVNLGSTPSLLLNPASSNVSGASEIVIGNADSPSGAAIQNFGIQSNTPLNSLTINSINSPVVNLITNNLELNGDLTIETGATLNCGERNLILNGNVNNDGLLSSNSGTVSLVHPVSGTVSGVGDFDFYNLERSGINGQTLVQTDLLVKNNFSLDAGEMDFEGNVLTVKGNVTTDGTLSFIFGSNGLVLSGTDQQILTRTTSGASEIDVVTINNENGVTIPAGFFEFKINKNIRLQNGIFALTGNLLEIAEGAVITPKNPFSENNMIVTGGAFANFGLLLHVPANSTDDIFVPLGIDRYMPINLDFSQSGYSSGSTASSYLLRLNIPENGVVIEDTEPGTNPQISDLNNVLGMYFSVDGSDIGDGLNMDLKFRYDQQYVQVTTPYTEEDYIAARVLADNTTISKLGPTAVDEVNDILTYNLQGNFAGDQFAVDGDYFAGVDDAIPNTIVEYFTIVDGNNVNDGLTTYNQQVPGGGAPSGALVTVSAGHDLIFADINGVNFYRTVIEPGARIIIEETSQHRLGRVTGTGTIEVQGSATLPAGDYSGFFGCGGGKLAYKSLFGQSLEVLANLPPIEDVTLRGPGELVIADNDLFICNDLIITGGAEVKAANSSTLTVDGNIEVLNGDFDLRQGNVVTRGNLLTSEIVEIGFPPLFFSGQVISGNNGQITIEGNALIGGRGISLGTVFRETHVEGNVIKVNDPPSGSILDGNSGAKLILDGTLPQIITGEFSEVLSSDIPSLELNNGTGLIIDGNVNISEKLFLTDGNIFTNTDNLIRLTSDAVQVEPTGGQPTSFVDGPMQWTLGATTAEKKFPVGNNDRFRPLAISNRSAARTWEVEYSDTIASVVPGIGSMTPDPTNTPAIETVSIQEHWRVETDGGSTSANIGLSYGDDSGVSTSPGDQSNLLVLAYDEINDEWDSYGGDDFEYDTPTNSGSLMSQTPITFSERFITLGSSDELNPLPVTWLYFEGENKGKDNLLSWATSAEINNEYFKLERSLDALNWISVAEIPGAGLSNTTLSYTYTDENAPFGRVYYRLRQVDFDGQMEFAPNLVSLERGFSEKSKEFDFLLFPNPTQLGTVRFRMSNTYDVRANVSVFDLSGKQLSQSYVQIDGQGTSAPVECNFEPGIYLVTVIIEDKIRSKPLVITR